MNTLKKILIDYGFPSNASFVEMSFDANGCSFKKLGEILVDIGTILEEYTEDNIYIVYIRANFNPATIAIQTKNDKINLVSYAKEGWIKQKTAQKAADKIKACFK